MSRKKILIFIFILFAFIASFVLLNKDRVFEKRKSDPYQISVIYRSKSTESSTTIKQGIDQAARDFNVEISFLTLANDNSVQEQIALLQREVTNGAQAIIIAPVNSVDLKEPIEKTQKSIPVITMQSTVNGISHLPYISCNNLEFGTTLADTMIANGVVSNKIAVLKNSMGCSNIYQRYLGITHQLSTKKNTLEYWDIPDDPQEAYKTARVLLQNSDADTLVALDGATLETAAKAQRDSLKIGGKRVRIYGIGRTNMVVSLLDNQIINSVGVENEYNMGYLSVKAAIRYINKKYDTSNTTINFAIVNHENMYSSDNQRLLFPFVR